MAGRAQRIPRPALPPHVRRAARDAGGWGLSFVTVGVNLVVALSVVAIVVALARWLLVELVAGSGGIEDAVDDWLASIDPTPWIVTVVVAVLVAAGLVALGASTSVRILRRAGVPRPREITWWCCGIGTLVQAGITIVGSGVTTLVGLLTSGLGLGIVVALSLVLSTALSALAGYVAGPRLWAWRVRRDGERAGLLPV
ncbi:hypothetical protein [Agrococcus jejuensis]|uniref:Uncharacterized protein n=1 Tax=Agrococcus jejuensis TaxID=399736 RepID=A0A1G8E6J2_9MICO|nr:hypothetical protein [Agrococcus jejuensis]SDH65477.1 hypothetical protein SAMN04489720_1906 [Agrococcus jejuensis]